jgi:hypothetical protein
MRISESYRSVAHAMVALDVRKASQVTCEITFFHLSEVADNRGVPDALV